MSWLASTGTQTITLNGGTGAVNYTIHLPEGVSTDLIGEPASDIKAWEKPAPKRVSPRLYFSYVKHKMTKMQMRKIEHQSQKLARMVEKTKIDGQTALFEELSKQLAVSFKQIEIAACGMEHFIEKEVLTKHMNIVEDRVVKLSPVEEFPRLIPEDVSAKLKACRDRKLFDTYWVLYTDYTDQKDLKTNEKKIIEKDPILFGSLKLDKDVLYPIADWIDEHCDITIEKLVGALKSKEIGFNQFKVTKKYADSVIESAYDNFERLENTRRDNWRRNAEEQKEVTQSRMGKLWGKAKGLFRRST
jgi:hypothetical protein